MKTIAFAALVLLVAGCNTIDGVGQDISSGARTVQNTF
jgi:predicted small secreted protein